jgi:SAM-dependent methyltransferase
MSITEYVENVYKDFSDYLKSEQKLCNLKDLHFDGGNVPNYADVHLHQYYLLRFAYGYEFTYRQMFDDLLKKFPELKTNTIQILSIGCGTGIDSMALNELNSNIEYFGVDKLNWSYKYKNSNTEYFLDDINDWLSKQSKLNIDIICFPKSISELSDADITKAAKRFCKINQTKDLYILVSLRANEYTISIDIDKSELFIKELKNNGYTRTGGNKSREYTTFIHEREGIVKYNGYQEYPDEGVSLCGSLNEHCATFMNTGANCKCCTPQNLKRKPMLTVGTIKYQIIKLTR